jgi:C-methyltransferase./Hypothetical methyltransferase.
VTCRACGTELLTGLSLGELAISDFRQKGDVFKQAPLDVMICRECSLVQLGHTVPRETLYHSYWYRSGTQESMVRALREVAFDATISAHALRNGDVWIDIGANDGTLLSFVPRTLNRLAYEPAGNLWGELQQHGRIVGRYFPSHLQSAGLVGITPKAKVITSVACFYDVDDPNAFVRGIKACLADDGVWVNQMAYLPETLAANNFGDICHEHLTYWTLYAFQRLLAPHDLRVHSVSYNDVNGGSFRVVVKHGKQHDWASDRVGMLALRRFRQRIELHRSNVRSFLHSAKRDGFRVWGYGASTKGNTYLQYWGVGTDLVPCIVDRNPSKVGLFTPCGQVVVSEDALRREKPDMLLVLPWHFMDSFLEREGWYLDGGGTFVVPFPDLHIIDKSNASHLSTTTAAAAGA